MLSNVEETIVSCLFIYFIMDVSNNSLASTNIGPAANQVGYKLNTNSLIRVIMQTSKMTPI